MLENTTPMRQIKICKAQSKHQFYVFPFTVCGVVNVCMYVCVCLCLYSHPIHVSLSWCDSFCLFVCQCHLCSFPMRYLSSSNVQEEKKTDHPNCSKTEMISLKRWKCVWVCMKYSDGERNRQKKAHIMFSAKLSSTLLPHHHLNHSQTLFQAFSAPAFLDKSHIAQNNGRPMVGKKIRMVKNNETFASSSSSF